MNTASESGFCTIEFFIFFKLHVKLTVLIFWTQFAKKKKKLFLVKNGRSEHHHWILHIQISVSGKFQPKLTILIFWTKFNQKRCFWSKAKNFNITIEFCIFKLVYVLNFSLNIHFPVFEPNLFKKYIAS